MQLQVELLHVEVVALGLHAGVQVEVAGGQRDVVKVPGHRLGEEREAVDRHVEVAVARVPAVPVLLPREVGGLLFA